MSCQILPQGVWPVVPTLFTTLAWISSLFQNDCDYARVSGDIVQVLATNPRTPWLEIGYKAYREPREVSEGVWEASFRGRCLQYPNNVNTSDDLFWKLSIMFNFLALVLGGGATFFLWFSTCCTFSKGTWRWTGYEVFLASTFQAASFVFFKTDLCVQNKCELFWGSRSDMTAAALWMLAAVAIFVYYPEPPDDDEGADGIMVASTPSVIVTPPPFLASLESTEDAAETKAPDVQSEDRLASSSTMPSGQSSEQEVV